MARFVLICLGGALGTGLRYLVGLWATARFGGGLPVGTLLVNLVGCFLLAAVMQLAALTTLGETPRLALTAGFMGGLTTYSSFNFETTRLLGGGQPRLAIAYLALTLVGCCGAGLLGLAVTRRLLG